MPKTDKLSPGSNQAINLAVDAADYLVQQSLDFASNHPFSDKGETVLRLAEIHARVAVDMYLSLVQAKAGSHAD